jgi:hypothetical protein
MREQLLERIDACNSIKIKELRDIYWLISSDSLSQQLIPEYHINLISNSELPAILSKFRKESKIDFPKISSNLRLGKYAEQLVAFFIDKYSSYDLLSSQLQLIDKKQTKGEIDFLIQSKKINNIHLEFAIKYYIEHNKENKSEYWGPNYNDNWAQKKHKIVSFQSELTRLYPELLPSQFQSILFQKKILIFGQLFKKENMNSQNWCIQHSDLNKLETKGTFFYLAPKKYDWIFPFSKDNKLNTFSEIKSKIIQSPNRAKMIVCYNQKKIPTSWGFILYNSFPKDQIN